MWNFCAQNFHTRKLGEFTVFHSVTISPFPFQTTRNKELLCMTLVKTTKILKAVKIFLAQQSKQEAYTDTSLTPVLKALPEKAINRFRTYLSEFPN